MMKKGLNSGSGVSGDTFDGRNVHLEGAGGGGIRSPEVRVAAAGKKVRGAAQGFGPPPASPPPAKCQVEGCSLDLKGAKSYYCRHKVCGMHSKSPKVIVAGLEQRFCQQCSRFHLLKEFDQGKRSCRRRLAGHNERRRKPPPPELLPSRFDRLLPSFPENKSGAHRGYLLDFIQPRPPEPPRENVLWPSLRSDDVFSDEGIIGVSDSTRALSLLSSQLFDTATDPTLSLAHIDPLPHVIAPSINVETARPNTGINYLNLSRGFDDHQVGSSSFYAVGSRQSHDDGDEQLPSNDVGPIEVYDYLHDFHWLL